MVVYLPTIASIRRSNKTVFWEWTEHIVRRGYQVGVVVVCLDDGYAVLVLLGEKMLVIGLALGGCEFAHGTVEGTRGK